MPKPACACMIIIQTVAFGNKEHTKERKLENRFLQDITKTCLYNVDPFNPLLYSKTGVYKDTYIIFFILLKNIDCGYSLEPPRRGGSNEYPQSMF